MTPSEFAKTIRDKHPGAYDDISDQDLTSKVLTKYPQYQDMVQTSTTDPNAPARTLEQVPGMAPGEYPPESYTTFAPSANLAMLGQAGLGLAKAAPDIAEGVANLPSTIKGLLPNPSLRGLGAGAAQMGTSAGQDLAQAARSYGTAAQPEVGGLVAKAGQAAESGLSTAPSQASIFKQPIVKGMARDPQEMLGLATEHNKQIGEAIGNTLTGLDKTGVKFDPTPIIDRARDMLEKDAAGNLMTTGVQGETNKAIGEALSSLEGFAKGEKISWTDANRIKGLLQDSSKYAAKRFDQSNEAYKQVASLIKEGIDDQAGNVLQQTGGNIQDFQNLRNAYGKTAVLKQMLTNATGKELLDPSALEKVTKMAKWVAPHALLYGALYKTLRYLGGK